VFVLAPTLVVSRDLSRPVVAPPPSSTTELVVKKVRDVFKKYFDDTLKNATDSQGREAVRLKRLLNTMEIEVVAVIERQLQEQTVDPGAPRVDEVNRVGPVQLRRDLTVFPSMAEPFDVEAFLRLARRCGGSV
jgi:hypothetical protein